jgi:hypothetical protein
MFLDKLCPVRNSRGILERFFDGLPCGRRHQYWVWANSEVLDHTHHAPAKDARDESILAALADNLEAGLSTSQIAKEIKLSPRAARTRLVSLVERGLIVEVESGPQDPHRRYHLAAQRS